MNYSKTIRGIAYVIAIVAVVLFVFGSTPVVNAQSYDDGYYGGYDYYDYGGYDDYGYDNYDYGYNDYCYDCYYDDYYGYNDYCDYGCYDDYTYGYDNGGYVIDNNIYVNNTNTNTNINNNNNTGNNNNDNQLSASCVANYSVANEGETVRWSANVSGGNGNYQYSWSGTDGLSGSGSSVSKSYSNNGTKYASVLVTSGNKSVTANCGSVYIEDNHKDKDDFDVICRPDESRVEEGDTVRWEAEVDGVDEDDVDFDWSGDADGDDQEVTERYNRSGTYEARVRATYRGQTETDTCTVRVEDKDDNNTNVVLTQNPPTGQLASLSSVYLSQVPYTGAAENAKLIGFILSLILASLAGAYMYVTHKMKLDRKDFLANFKKMNLARKVS